MDEMKQEAKQDSPQEKQMSQSDRQKVLDDPAVQLLQRELGLGDITIREE